MTQETEVENPNAAIADGETRDVVTGVRKFVYLGLAGVFFLLGMIGAFVPGIPTTPFLLLMSYFLVRVSPRLNEQVQQWPLVGKPLRDWEETGGVNRRVKWLAYSMCIIFVGLSVSLGGLSWPLNLLIILLAFIGIYVVYRLPLIDLKG